MKKIILFIFLLTIHFQSIAQDFNCNISVLSENIQSSDKRIFGVLENALIEFMNNRKWSDDIISSKERINCNIVIDVRSWNGTDEFSGNAQIQLSRPVFGTSYTTTLLNISDKDFSFSYSDGQSLDFNESNNTSNLTSMLAYYANIMLGLDYDSFSLEGGSSYLQKAFVIVNNSQNLPARGWKAPEDTRNRYWLIENLLNANCKPLRQVSYLYHRKGLDVLQSNEAAGRKQINDCIPLLKEVQKNRPNTMAQQMFFIAKADELVNFFSNANPSEKSQIVTDLSLVDPANISKYQAILKN